MGVQGNTFTRAFGMIFSLGLACSPAEKGPEVPLTDAELAAKEAEASGASEGESDPTADSLDEKYTDLPLSFRQGIVSCENQGRYFDLTAGACSETTLSSFECDVQKLLAAEGTVLSAQLKTKLQDYITANLTGFTLFACTETTEAFDLHFYMPTEDKVRSYNVKLVKTTP